MGLQARQCTNLFAGFDSIEAGHLPIDKDDVVGLVAVGRLLDHLDTFPAGRRFMHHECHACQHARFNLAGLRVVVDDQDASAAKVGPGETPCGGVALCKIGGKPKCASFSHLAGDSDIATH